MEWFQAVVLGLVQGLTEFLPVSSSGHLTIFKAIFGVDADNLSFEVAVHAATVLSTIVAFRKEIWNILGGVFKFRYNAQTSYFLKICVSMIPVFVVGVFFKDFVTDIFGSGLVVVGCMLLLTSVLLTLGETLSNRQARVAATEGPGARTGGKLSGCIHYRYRPGICCFAGPFAFRFYNFYRSHAWCKEKLHGSVLFPYGSCAHSWRGVSGTCRWGFRLSFFRHISSFSGAGFHDSFHFRICGMPLDDKDCAESTLALVCHVLCCGCGCMFHSGEGMLA